MCMYMYVYMCVCMFVYIYMGRYMLYMYVYIYICVCVIYVCIYMYVYMYMCIYIYVCVYKYMYIYVCVCIYVYMYICVCARVLCDLQDNICVSEKWGIFKNCFSSGLMMINHGFLGDRFWNKPKSKNQWWWNKTTCWEAHPCWSLCFVLLTVGYIAISTVTHWQMGNGKDLASSVPLHWRSGHYLSHNEGHSRILERAPYDHNPHFSTLQ